MLLYSLFLFGFPHSVGGLNTFALQTFVRMILGEYKQTVYKRYNVVGNGPDSVLETSCAIFNPENVLS